MRNSALILEDELIIALSLRHILEDEGFADCTIRTDGNEGVKTALRKVPDLIIADLNLPAKNAFEVIRELRCSDMQVFPQVLIISGFNIDENRLSEVGLSNENFLKKPFRQTDIARFLKTKFSSSKLLNNR